MSIFEVVLIAVGLAMDAFAVSVCKGLAGGKIFVRNMLKCGLWFGLFQMIMPLVGFAFASVFSTRIKFITPWISFALLALLGVKMIVEAFRERNNSCDGEECRSGKSAYSWTAMLALAVATSIDALAVGVTFAFHGVSFDISLINNIWLYIGIIGLCTFLISAAGNAVGGGLGTAFGMKFKFAAALLGGLILCALAVKFLVTGIIDVTSAEAVLYCM